MVRMLTTENLREDTVRMQTPGESSRKHGPDVNPRKHFEKTRSGCKPRESLRKNMVRMQTPGKSSRKHGQDANPRKVFEKTWSGRKTQESFEKTRSRCKPQERLRENTVRMQTDELPPNRFTLLFRAYPCILPMFLRVFWAMEA